MGLLKFLGLGQAAGDAIASPVEAVGNALDKLFTSDDERAAATAVMTKIAQQPHILQAEINKLEAQHRSVWVAGWRPAIGWVAALSLFAFFVPQYGMASWIWVKTCLAAHALQPYPVEAKGLLELVMSLLGLGALRTLEKFGGKAK